MPSTKFHSKSGTMTLNEIARIVSGEIHNKQANETVHDIATLKDAGPNEISFLGNQKYKNDFINTKAGFCLVSKAAIDYAPKGTTLIVCENPYAAYAIVSILFYPTNPVLESKIAATAIIPNSCTIGENVIIEDYVVLGENVTIGSGSHIKAHSVIMNDVSIGSNCQISASVTISHTLMGKDCIIHPGARIGQDGFGFAPSKSGILKIPQLGMVVIGNSVEIGANTCIDRGAIEDTIIGDGTKIDNQVQVGHNVIIGKNCFICGQVGLAGSTKVGDYVSMGGQSGSAGHLTIASGSMIAGQSGVISDIETKMIVGGTPALPIREWHKMTAMLKKLITKGHDDRN